MDARELYKKKMFLRCYDLEMEKNNKWRRAMINLDRKTIEALLSQQLKNLPLYPKKHQQRS